MNVALIGSGYWGKHYARILNELFRLRYIVDLNPSVLVEFQTKYPNTICTSSITESLKSDIDAVFVVTPASVHFDIAKQALLADKHVFVEKPLTTLAEQSSELVKIAKERGLRLMTGFTFLFVPAVIRAREIIGDNTPYYLTSRRLNMGPVRNDVSVVSDLVSHDVAMFLYLTRSEVQSVSASGSSFLAKQNDVVNVSLRFKNGVLATILASWAEPRKIREFVIVGPKQTIVIDDVDVRAPLTIYHRGISREETQTSVEDFGSFKLVTKSGSLEIPDIPIIEPLKSEILHFKSCINDPSIECVSDGNLGYNVTKILQAIETSITLDGQPVCLQ